MSEWLFVVPSCYPFSPPLLILFYVFFGEVYGFLDWVGFEQAFVLSGGTVVLYGECLVNPL